MDFFDISKSFKPIKLKGGTTNGYIKVNENFEEIPQKKIEGGKTYIKPYVMKERLDLLDYTEKDLDESNTSNVKENQLTALTSVGTIPDFHEIDKEKSEKIYAQYMKKPIKDDNLIIHEYKSKILSMVEANEVTIISGPTGCGKTTKVPQYILDLYAENNQYCNIIVTQPRRIAAITIAKRVCEEREWPLPGICGYKVGLQEKTSGDTRLLFVTVGVFLQILISKKHMNDFTHVILDEVHERDQDTDFAMLVVKQFLNWNSRNVKIILMSATADTTRFANYFERPLCSKFQPAPIINIKKPNEFTVSIYYLEELSSLGKLPTISLADPSISDLLFMMGISLIKCLEMLDGNSEIKKSVLVFLPGIYEIEQFYDRLRNPEIFICGNVEYKWHCVPLHSSITVEEQIQAFLPPPKGFRKIILATNIAESSITVPDITYVIDYCLTRILVTDSESNFTCLQLCWASKDNLIQRAGRVGRVMNGRVYRMIYKDNYQELEDHCIPGMLRCPLERVVLQAKKMNIGPPKAVLALAMDPPDLRDIVRTILILKEAGALLLTINGSRSDSDGDLTTLGLLMASLPVDIHISKLIALGFIFNCMEECIIMGAAMSLKSLFNNPFRSQMQSYNAKLDWADGSCSDCIAFLNVYQVWKDNHQSGYFKRSVNQGELNWAKRHFLQLRTLKETSILVDEIKMRLKHLGFEPSVNGFQFMWNEIEKSLILKFVIAGAFYPNYFTRGARGGQIDEKEAIKALGGRDPFSTVYFQNYPLDQPPNLYSELICQKMNVCRGNMRITYDHSKVFIEFQDNDIMKSGCDIPYKCKVPGKIPMAVYRAVKMRSVFKDFEIKMLPSKEANKLFEEITREPNKETKNANAKNCETPNIFQCCLPRVDMNYIDITVTHVESPSRFWATESNESTRKIERDLFRWLNGPQVDVEELTSLPEVGDMLIAPYEYDQKLCYYRARVDEVIKSLVKIYFLDYGNSKICEWMELRKYGPRLWEAVSKIPAQAFQCTLTNIRPSAINNLNGKWSYAANKAFVELIDTEFLQATVYSVVNGVVSVVLNKIFKKNVGDEQIDINQKLIELGHAEFDKETFLSEMSSEIRKNRNLDKESIEAYNFIQAKDACTKPLSHNFNINKSHQITVSLRGPFSPLEMKLFSNTRNGSSKLVKIASTSVNSVLLDSNPQDPLERLVVACHVGQNHSGATLILHNTTIMPHIHGLASLIPLIFAPTAEFRVNKQKTSYTGVLCGLGIDEEGFSLFPDHDMEIVFDCEFSFEDVVTINKLRYAMGNLLGEIVDGTMRSYPDMIMFQQNLKESFVKLIQKSRRSKELEFPKKQFDWSTSIENIETRNQDVFSLKRVSIFPIHQAVRIKSKKYEEKKILEDLANLKKIISSRFGEKKENIKCKLCDFTLKDLNFLELHLKSESHLLKEKKLLESQS